MPARVDAHQIGGRDHPRQRYLDEPGTSAVPSVLSQWFVTDVAEWVRQVEPPGPGVGTSVSFFGDGTLAARGRSLFAELACSGSLAMSD